jgi:hypothetical protein
MIMKPDKLQQLSWLISELVEENAPWREKAASLENELSDRELANLLEFSAWFSYEK